MPADDFHKAPRARYCSPRARPNDSLSPLLSFTLGLARWAARLIVPSPSDPSLALATLILQLRVAPVGAQPPEPGPLSTVLSPAGSAAEVTCHDGTPTASGCATRDPRGRVED